MPDDLSQAILASWTIPLWPTILTLIAGAVYLRGWRMARQTRPKELPGWRALCFVGGLLVFWLSLASPVDALGQFLLSAHMAQHLALMSVAPPLLVLGAPTVPILRGLPRALVRDDIAPWMNSGLAHGLERFFLHPAIAWLLMNVTLLAWHIPAAYELALRSNGWHEVEHACFFFTSIPFWWFVLQPWPSRSRWSRWFVLPFLMSADIVNTALSAMLTFCGRVLYPTYARVPRIADIDALHDQVAAGAGMWVIGSLLFLVPLMVTTVQLLQSKRRARQLGLVQITPKSYRSFDLLRTPLVGPLLRSRYGRLSLQVVSFVLMTVFIVQGIHGVQVSGLNLSGAMLWNIVRPLTLVVILLAGNLFCMACPFTLPRELGRALGLGHYRWPEWLRNKWPATALLILFFWAYEQLSLWNSPRLTALLLIGYIGAAFVIDSLFQGAAFCKYVCPVGQFNFATSLVSPVELGVRSQQVCNSCTTHDCLRGNDTQRGCELQLYLPQKVGNLDCTLCMDCVKACPHDNVGITLQAPTRDLIRDPIRSSIRRLSTRRDIAVVLLIVSFSSLVNAGLMIAPISDRLATWQSRHLLLGTDLISLLATFLFCAAVLLLCVGVAKLLQVFSTEKRIPRLLAHFSVALLPLGLAMWSAHLFFHLTTAGSSFVPVLQQAFVDLGSLLHVHAVHAPSVMAMSSTAQTMPASLRPEQLMLLPGGKGINLFGFQIWILDLGLLLSLYAGWRIIRQISSSTARAGAMLAVWASSSSALYALSVWIFTQPMQMRGMAM